jgi:hypothetical protein
MKILRPNEMTKIVPEREFRKPLRDLLLSEILLPTVEHSPNGMRIGELITMAGELDSWFCMLPRYLGYAENEIKMFGMVPSIVRPHRIRLERTLAHLRNAEKELDRATATAQHEQKEGLKRGILDFRTARVALRKGTTEVIRLRHYVIRHLPPDQRTGYENDAIRSSRAVIAHGKRGTKRYADVRNEVIMETAAKLKQITKGRVPDSRINRAISAFFNMIGPRVEIGKVKTIRHRLTLQTQTKGGSVLSTNGERMND